MNYGYFDLKNKEYVITKPDTPALEADFGFKPSTTLREGLRAFAEWYREFYK